MNWTSDAVTIKKTKFRNKMLVSNDAQTSDISKYSSRAKKCVVPFDMSISRQLLGNAKLRNSTILRRIPGFSPKLVLKFEYQKPGRIKISSKKKVCALVD